MEDFDNKFNTVWIMSIIAMIVSFAISIGGLVFIAWVVIQILQHFGII